MINVYISDRIYIKTELLSIEVRRSILKKYSFLVPIFNGNSYEEESITLVETVTKNNIKWTVLPPNLTYFIDILKDNNVKDFFVIDNRSLPVIESFPKCNIKLYPEQEELFKNLDLVDFNSIINASTGTGKTLCAVEFTKRLRTTCLFVASKTSYLESFKKEVSEHIENGEEYITTINTKWLKDGANITPYMVCSVQVLTNKKIQEALKDKVGLLVGDELHLSLLSTEYRKGIYGVNPRHRLYLSATPKTKAQGFVEAGASNNIISMEKELDFMIYYFPLFVETDIIRDRFKALPFHEKKNLVYSNKDFKLSCVKTLQFFVSKERNFLVYCTDFNFQEYLKEELLSLGIKVETINKSSKKRELRRIFKEYDEGKIQGIIGGTAIVEALSLYKLSVILDVDLSATENSIQQLIGRLKRKDDTICDKQKLYFKVILKDLTENKFIYVIKPTLNIMKKYVKLMKTRVCSQWDLLSGIL